MSTTFIQKALIKHKDKYDYTNVHYVNSQTKVLIICSNHGGFWQRPNDHLQGNGCPGCGRIIAATKKTQSYDEIITRCRQVHGCQYEYGPITIRNKVSKIAVKCAHHGEWTQFLSNHLSGKGCYKCGRILTGVKKRMNTDYVVMKFQQIHGNKYDYSQVQYVKSCDKVDIVCPAHGSWSQTPNNHLQGYGCPKCIGRISKSETKWLDSLGIPSTSKNRQVTIWILNQKITVDGFDPNTNTVYEYYGNYWHGNPRYYAGDDINECTLVSFGVLYQKTMNREALLISAGYKVISKWGD